MISGKKALLLASIGVFGLIGIVPPASAQDVVMRRPITSVVGHEYAWDMTPFRPVDGSGNNVDPLAACGDYTMKREVTCVTQHGDVVGDGFCSAVSKPTDTDARYLDAGCSYSWDQSGFVDPGNSCTHTETHLQTVVCKIDQLGVPTDDAKCAGEKPPTAKVVPDYSACTYTWNEGAWVDPGVSCTAAEVQERMPTCHRDLDGALSSDGLCDPALKPETTRTVEDFGSCTFSWEEGPFVDADGPSCNSAEVQERSVRCLRSNGDYVDDSACSTPKPALTQTVVDHRSCSYSWKTDAFRDPGASCTATETQDRNVWCERSNGERVEDSFCANAGARPPASQTVEDFSACTYGWLEGGWQDPGASCSNAERQTQSVVCRSSDGRDVDGSFCGGGRPASERTVVDHSACTYDWQPQAFGAWENTCSANTVRRREVWCVNNQLGGRVADALCHPKPQPSMHQDGEDFSTCGYQWIEEAWNEGGAACTSAETQTRNVWCRRSDGAQAPNEALCGAGKPATSRSVPDVSGCTAQTSVSWGPYQWGSTCSTNTHATQTGTCLVNGQPADPSFCAAGGKSLTQTHYGLENLSGCGYDWIQTGWSAWNSTCSSAANRTQTVYCRRSDGATVPDATCVNAGRGGVPPRSETAQVLSGCGYTPSYEAWSACSASGTQTRTASCQRSDGAWVATSACGLGGETATTTQSQACDTFQWAVVGDWSGYGACTNNQRQRTRPVACHRVNNGVVYTDPDASCEARAGARPASVEYQECSSAPAVTGGHIQQIDGYADLPAISFTSPYFQSGQVYAGVGHGNWNFEGLSCRFNVTVTYNGETGVIFGEQPASSSGSCYANGSAVIGGRTFQASYGASPDYYARDYHEWRLTIN